MEVYKRKKLIYRVTLVGSLVNIILVILKITAGIVGRSGAMLADGIHSLSDFITDLIVVFFVRLSSKPKDHDHAYGHGKYETLATAFVGFAILFVGFGIFIDAIKKIQTILNGGTIEQPTLFALYAAILSILSKELLYHYTKRVGKQVNSTLVLANAWHHRSDAFSSIGTLIGIGGAILLGNKWVILDPIAAVLVSVFILQVAYQLMAPSLNDLLEKSLPQEIQEKILSIITENPEVSDPHDLHTRRIGNDFAIECHIRVRPDMTVVEGHHICCEIEHKLREEYGQNTHITIHLEPYAEFEDPLCK